MGVSVLQAGCVAEQARSTSLGDLAGFRGAFYDCLTLRADALFELTDAVLCSDGPVTTLVGLTLTAEHRRGHGALYDGLGSGRIQVDRLRRSLANLPMPRDAQGRITLGVDVSPWLRPDATTTAEFRPSAEEAAEATRGAIALVDGTLWPCWSWAGERELWAGKYKTTGHGSLIVTNLAGRLTFVSEPVRLFAVWRVARGNLTPGLPQIPA